MTITRGAAVAALVLASLALTGCSSAGSEAGAADDTVRSFRTALADDPAQACALLAPDTRAALEEDGDCTTALGDLELPSGAPDIRDTAVAGHSARAKLADDEIFMALFDDGWRVVAAGCTRPSGDPAEPADCTLED